MSRLLFAIALGMAMQAATAQAAPPGWPQAPAAAVSAVSAVTAVSATSAGVMQASLSLPEHEAKGSAPVTKTAAVAKPAADAKEADDEQRNRPTTGAMLLAALLLMTGIALRRWGAGQQ